MNKKQKINLTITSTILFLAAAIVSYIPFQLSSFFFSKILGVSTDIEFYKVIYTSPNNSPAWFNASIIVLYGFPPFLSFFLALITRRIYDKARKKSSNLKLFLAWLNIHFDNLMWGAIIAGIITSSGFAYFLNWIYIPFVVQIVIASAGIALLFSLNKFTLFSFIQTSPSRQFINKENQLSYKKFIIYFPVLIGTLILVSLSFPHSMLHERILNITFLIPLIRTAQYIDEEDVKLVRRSKVFQPNYSALLLILIYVLVFQFL